MIKNINNNLSFSGKYIINGKKEELDEIEQKISSKKHTYKSISKFSVCYNKQKQLYMNLYATQEDSYALQRAKRSSEFLPTFKNTSGTLTDKFKKLTTFVFGSLKDINVIKAEDILSSYRCAGFHPDTGAVNNKTIEQLDGSTVTYSAYGETKEKTIIETDEEGVTRTFVSKQNYPFGTKRFLQKEEFLDGSYRTYYQNGLLSEEKSEDGTLTSFYQNGNISSKKDPNGNITKFYESGSISEEQNTDGSSKKYLPNGCISQEISSSGFINNYQYRNDGKGLLFRTSSDGNTYFYDENGNQVDNVEIKRKNNKLISVKFDSGIVLTYDNDSNMISKLDEDGILYEFGGKNFKYTSTMITPDGTKTEYFLNDINSPKIKSITNPDGSKIVFFLSSSAKAPFASKYDADGCGRTYNSKGRLLAETLPNGTRTEYFPNGQIHRIFVNNVEQVIYRQDGTTYFIKNENGENQTYYTDGTLSYSQDSQGNKEFYFKNGQLKSQINTDGSWVKYSENGILLEELSADGTYKKYNDDGQIFILSNPQDGVTTWYYNNAGELTTKKLPNGTTEKYKNGKLRKEIFPDGSITKHYIPYQIIMQAYASFSTKLAWNFSQTTKDILSEEAKNNAYISSIIAKIQQNKIYKDTLENGEDVSELETAHISRKEHRAYLSYLKNSWNITGTEEFSSAKRYAHEIFLTMSKEGLDGIKDPQIKEFILEWKEENPDKYQVLFG